VTEDEFVKVVAKHLDCARAAVTRDARLDELGADSVALAQLALALEERFDIEVADADVLAMRTIGDLRAYVEARHRSRR
jgi:acyl carrier protein